MDWKFGECGCCFIVDSTPCTSPSQPEKSKEVSLKKEAREEEMLDNNGKDLFWVVLSENVQRKRELQIL
jgi:hypothetical protein